MDIAIILLAAGSSSRMGVSKQLLDINGTPLLAHVASLATQSGIGDVVVVLGSNEREHRKGLRRIPVDIVVNQLWERGMGGSIKAGLSHCMAVKPNLQAVIILVCDQPLLTSEHLNKLKEKFIETKKSIVASYYSGSPGVPVLFEKSLFNEILNLGDEQGAKKIILAHPELTISIDFEGGAVDLDTLEDYRNFVS